MPSLPFLEDPIADQGVALRDAAERDIPEILIAHQDDPKLHVRLGLPRPPSGAELGRQMELAERERSAGGRVRLTIVEPGSDDCRGRVSVTNIDWENRCAELGSWLAPQARGQGMAGGALRLTARWLFEAWGLRRVQVLTEPDNEAMLAAARGAGFVEEGVVQRYNSDRGTHV